MIELKVSQILEATRGSLIQGSVNQDTGKINTDSRTIKPGELFLALDGDNYKGENFIGQSLAKGASGYISRESEVGSREIKGEGRGLSPVQSNGDCPTKIAIEVENSLKALQDIAHCVLNKVKPKVIAITGSTGKTSVREMLRSILSLKYEVVASKANYNNEIGLPLTLLELNPSTKIVILEMAMRGLGQINELCQIAMPDIAVITNVGLSHIELLESEDNIIDAKAEIIKGLKKEGIVILNSDDEATAKFRSLTDRYVLFGSGAGAEVKYQDVSIDELAKASFTLNFKDKAIKITLPVAGRQNVANACAAAAVAFYLGAPVTHIKKGLESIKPTPGRMHVTKANEWIILDDSYNASPASMAAAINVLRDIKAGRKVTVLGDMLELGNISLKEHVKLGHLVARSGINVLFTVGSLGKHIGQAAIEGGMPSSSIHSFSDCSELNREIISYLKPQDAILIKASRAIKLDEVAYCLQKKR